MTRRLRGGDAAVAVAWFADVTGLLDLKTWCQVLESAQSV